MRLLSAQAEPSPPQSADCSPGAGVNSAEADARLDDEELLDDYSLPATGAAERVSPSVVGVEAPRQARRARMRMSHVYRPVMLMTLLDASSNAGAFFHLW